MRMTKSFPEPEDSLKREAALPDFEFLPDSQLMIKSISALRAGGNVVVWAMVDDPQGQPKRIYLFTYSPSQIEIPLDQLEGKTIGYARGLFYRAMNEAFAYPTERTIPVGTAVPRTEEWGPMPVGKAAPAAPAVPELPAPMPSLPRAQASAKEKILGGKSAGMTVEDVAKKHGLPVSKIEEQLAKGVKVEMEHTGDRELAREIAMDHLVEFADYYDRLEVMEEGGDCVLEALRKFVKGVDKDWNYITPEELHKKGTKGYNIVDLRKPDEFAKGHIAGAKNIFWMDLLDEKNLKKFPKDGKILLVCYVGHTSSQMVVALRLLGYDAVSLKYGMGKSPVEGVPVAGWLDYGYEVVK